jgi:hypothetical protein
VTPGACSRGGRKGPWVSTCSAGRASVTCSTGLNAVPDGQRGLVAIHGEARCGQNGTGRVCGGESRLPARAGNRRRGRDGARFAALHQPCSARLDFHGAPARSPARALEVALGLLPNGLGIRSSSGTTPLSPERGQRTQRLLAAAASKRDARIWTLHLGCCIRPRPAHSKSSGRSRSMSRLAGRGGDGERDVVVVVPVHGATWPCEAMRWRALPAKIRFGLAAATGPEVVRVGQPGSRVDSTMQLPGVPLSIAAAPSQNPGTSWLAMN